LGNWGFGDEGWRSYNIAISGMASMEMIDNVIILELIKIKKMSQ